MSCSVNAHGVCILLFDIRLSELKLFLLSLLFPEMVPRLYTEVCNEPTNNFTSHILCLIIVEHFLLPQTKSGKLGVSEIIRTDYSSRSLCGTRGR